MWINWEHLRCVAHSPLIVGMTIVLLFSLGTCFVQIQSVRINFACTKRLFNFSAEAIINVRNAHLCARCSIFLLKIKRIPSFLSFGQRVYIFEEDSRSIQDVIGDVYCPGKHCFNREKCESLDGYVTTPRSKYGYEKCGAWLFVHKVPSCYNSTYRRHKQTKPVFYSIKKWTCYPTKNCYFMSLFNQPSLERKICVWTTKYKRLLEMCIVQYVEMKSAFTFQPVKCLVSTTVKSAKPAATFSIFFYGPKADIYVVWRWWNTLLFKKDELRRQKRRAISFFEEISPPVTIKHTRTWAKKGKSHSSYGLIVWTPHCLIELTKNSLTFSFFTLSFYSKATWFSQSPTTVLSGVSILDQIQWLWL